jgi:predicted phosphoadenosine phosphosulfate sulfurtransferase
MNAKIRHSIELLRNSEELALKYNDFGFHLAFSGGKDSQVVYELAKMAGVKFKAFFYRDVLAANNILRRGISELWSEDKTAWAAPHVCTQESPCL